MSTEWIDLLIIGVIALSALTGLFRGVVKEIIALIIWILAVWIAYQYSPRFSSLLKNYIHDPTAQTVVVFILIVLVVLILGAIINGIIGFVLKKSGLGVIDKILGMVFGFVRGVFIVSVVLATVKMTSLPYEQYVKKSSMCAAVDPAVKWVSQYIPALIARIKSVDTVNSKIESIIDTTPHQ